MSRMAGLGRGRSRRCSRRVGQHRQGAGNRPEAMPEEYSGLICHATADWFPIPDHAGVGRLEDAKRFRGLMLRSCAHRT